MNRNDFILGRNRDKKKRLTIIKATITCIIAMFIVGCNGDKTDESFPKVTHLALQTEKDGKWGLIGVDGKVLFENKLIEKPSYAVNGVFRIREHNSQKGIDVLKYYWAEKTPKSFGNQEGYVGGGMFSENLLPVVSMNERIHYLKDNGDTAFWLNPYKGKEIILVSPFFSDKRAWFMLEDDKYGFIDTNGHVVIEPIYDKAYPFHEGKAIVYNKDRKVYLAVDVNGKELFEVSGNNPETHLYTFFANGYCVLDDFICNEKGERIQRLPTVYHISPFIDSIAIFQNDEYVWQQINLNGKYIGDTQYQCTLGMMEDITYVGDALLKSNDEHFNISALDKKGNELYRIKNVSGFFPLYNYVVIKENGKCYFANKNGVPINNDMYSQIIIPFRTYAPGYPLVCSFLYAPYSLENYASGGVLSSYFDDYKTVSSILSKLTNVGFGKTYIGQAAKEITRMKHVKELKGITQIGIEKGINRVYASYEVGLLPELYTVCYINIKLHTENLPLKKNSPRIRTAIKEYLEKELGFKKRKDTIFYTSPDYNYDIIILEDENTICLLDQRITQLSLNE